MSELSLHNIDQISRDIAREEITFSHLLEDLIDHVCCDVESEMKNGAEFTEAYQKVKQKMGKRRLKEIQEETLFLVDTKYRNMKNTMKISGIAGTIMFGLAASFKIQHWPLAGIMMFFGAVILAFIFLPSALIVLWKETHNRKRLFLAISAFCTGMLLIIGTLFKIQHWPMAGSILTLAAISGILFFIPALALNRLSNHGNKAKQPAYILGAAGIVFFVAGLLFKIQHWPLATMFIIAGIILLFFLSFPLFTWLTWKEENHISSTFIYMVIGSLLIIIPGAMITLNLQNSYQAYFYINNDQQKALNVYLLSNNSSLVNMYRDSITYAKMEQLHSKTKGMLKIISSVRKNMVQKSESLTGKSAVNKDQISGSRTDQEILYNKLSRPFDKETAKAFLMPGCSAREELNSSMAEYENYLSGIISSQDLLKYRKMLDTETFLPDGSPDKTEISLMSALHSLEIMENGLLTVEACILNKICRHK
jgi:hypothetical protein